MSHFYQISPEEWELIENYLNNELSADAGADFEKRRIVDDSWEGKIRQVQLTMLGIGEVEMKHRMDHFHKSLEGDAILVTMKNRNWKKWLIAASFMVCVAAGSVLIWGESSNKKLFKAYYKPDPGLPTVMGVSDNYEFENAMVSYKMADYKKALSGWGKLLKGNPGNDTLNYFIGSAYLATSNDTQALIYLDKVIAYPASAFVEEAKWYKVLALIRQDKKKEAEGLLQQIKHPDKETLLQRIQ